MTRTYEFPALRKEKKSGHTGLKNCGKDIDLTRYGSRAPPAPRLFIAFLGIISLVRYVWIQPDATDHSPGPRKVMLYRVSSIYARLDKETNSHSDNQNLEESTPIKSAPLLV
jgi:hypothetical protein